MKSRCTNPFHLIVLQIALPVEHLLFCINTGITNYDEYSLVHDIVEEKKEENYGTLKKDKTLMRDDKKMEKLKQKLHTDDDSEFSSWAFFSVFLFLNALCSGDTEEPVICSELAGPRAHAQRTGRGRNRNTASEEEVLLLRSECGFQRPSAAQSAIRAGREGGTLRIYEGTQRSPSWIICIKLR